MPVLDLRNVTAVYVGTKEVIALYVGNTEVWRASGTLWDTFLSRDFTPSSSNALLVLRSNSIPFDEAKLQANKIAFLDFIKAVVIRGVTYPVKDSGRFGGITLENYPSETIPKTERIGLVIKEDSYFKNPSGQWYPNFSSTTWSSVNTGKLSLSDSVFKSASVNPYNVKTIRFDGQLIPVTAVRLSGSSFELTLGAVTMPSGSYSWQSKSFDVMT